MRRCGQRASTVVVSPLTEFIYDAGGSVVAERESTDGGSSWTWTKGYVYLGGQMLVQYNGVLGAQGATTYFAHKDHLGSTRLLTKYPLPVDPAQWVQECDDYLPFGELQTSVCQPQPPPPTTTTTHKFTGKERDAESDLDYFGARHYASPLARFLQVDPKLTGVPFPEHIANPQRLNMYAYAANNPLKFADPQGEDIEVVVIFRGNFSEEEKKKIIEAINRYLKKLDVGKVLVREWTGKDKRTLWQKVKDFVESSSGFAKITVTEERAPRGRPAHLAGLVFAGEFSHLRPETDTYANAIADTVLHETLVHQLGLGEQPSYQHIDGLAFDPNTIFRNDPYVVERRGTLYDSNPITRSGDPRQGPRALHPRDQTAIEERLKPINRKYKE